MFHPLASASLPASGGMERRRNQRALILSALKTCSVNPACPVAPADGTGVQSVSNIFPFQLLPKNTLSGNYGHALIQSSIEMSACFSISFTNSADISFL